VTVLRRWLQGQRGALLVAAVGILLCVVGLWIEPHRVGAAWLAAVVFWIGLPIGSLAMLLINGLTGGGWQDDLRSELLGGLAVLPLLCLALLPVVVAASELYGWAAPGAPAINPYLSFGFFLGRALVFVLLWNLLALVVGLRVAAGGSLGSLGAGLGLLLLVLSTTFAVIDWIMSLEAPWTSSAFGLMVSISWVMMALAFTIGARVWAMAGVATLPPERMRDLANLLLAAVMGLGYVSFMQYLIIWEENLSHEVVWFLHRYTVAWLTVAVIMVLARLVIPFLLLLFRRAKQSRNGLLCIAALLVVGHLATSWWLVVPSFGYAGLSWLDPAALAGLGGLVVALFLEVRPALREASARPEPTHG
jgi:hypothetical protein